MNGQKQGSQKRREALQGGVLRGLSQKIETEGRKRTAENHDLSGQAHAAAVKELRVVGL